MKVLKVILIIVLVLFGAYSIWMATLPSEYTLIRKAEINAPAAKTYAQVLDMKTWKNWSYWDLMDSTNTVTYNGETGEIGSGYAWKGEQTGEGTMTVTGLDENKKIDYSIDFSGQGASDGYFEFVELENGNTEVSYALSAEFGFFDRFGKLFLDGIVGNAFDESLKSLDEYIQTVPDAPEGPKAGIEVTDYPALPYYAITDRITMEELTSEFYGSRYAQIIEYLGEDAANMLGAPFAIVEEWDEENGMTTVAVSLAVSSEKEGTDRIKKGITYEGMVIKGTHLGSYESSGKMHYAIDDYAKANNMEIIGMPWEVYVTDPSTEPDTAKWVTEIYYPVAKATSGEEEAEAENTEQDEAV
jgi:effector-binding domain-containing protein